MNKHIKLIFISLTAAFSLIYTAEVKAQVDTSYTPLTTVPGVFKANEPTNPVAVLKNLYGFAIGVGAIIGIVMIMYAGFEYMYVESVTGKSDAKKRIQDVFLGLAVILGSYLLLRTINPALVNFNVNLPGGSGRVAHISIAQNLSDAARSQTQQALADSALLRSQITELEKEKLEIEKGIDELGGGTPDPVDMARLEEIEKQIRTKKVVESSIRTAADASEVAITIDENIYQRAAGLVSNEDNISARQTSALNFFDQQLAELRALDDQNDPQVKSAINQLVARKEAAAEEFKQQPFIKGALSQSESLTASNRRSSGETLIREIREDAAIYGKKLRDVGLTVEARQYEERAQVRISALCGANYCGN
jgi:hypothetical protein